MRRKDAPAAAGDNDDDRAGIGGIIGVHGAVHCGTATAKTQNQNRSDRRLHSHADTSCLRADYPEGVILSHLSLPSGHGTSTALPYLHPSARHPFPAKAFGPFVHRPLLPGGHSSSPKPTNLGVLGDHGHVGTVVRRREHRRHDQRALVPANGLDAHRRPLHLQLHRR
jgi:hypothetical protein